MTSHAGWRPAELLSSRYYISFVESLMHAKTTGRHITFREAYLTSDITLHMSLEDSFGNVVSGQLPSSKESTS